MYNRKNVGPRVKPGETAALTGLSCENFPFRTARSHLLLRNDEIMQNTRHKIP